MCFNPWVKVTSAVGGWIEKQLQPLLCEQHTILFRRAQRTKPPNTNITACSDHGNQLTHTHTHTSTLTVGRALKIPVETSPQMKTRLVKTLVPPSPPDYLLRTNHKRGYPTQAWVLPHLQNPWLERTPKGASQCRVLPLRPRQGVWRFFGFSNGFRKPSLESNQHVTEFLKLKRLWPAQPIGLKPSNSLGP